jgi:hypothetical protein
MTLFTQHFQDKQYVSALRTFVLRRLALPCLHHSLPSVLNPQISLLEYMKSMRGLQWFQWVGLAVFFLGWIQQYRCHMLLVSVYSLVAIPIVSHQHLMSCFLMGSPHLIRPASALVAGQNSSHRCKIFPVVSRTLQYPYVFKGMLVTETWEYCQVGRIQEAHHLMVNLPFVIGFITLKESTYRYSWHCKTVLTRQTKGR